MRRGEGSISSLDLKDLKGSLPMACYGIDSGVQDEAVESFVSRIERSLYMRSLFHYLPLILRDDSQTILYREIPYIIVN